MRLNFLGQLGGLQTTRNSFVVRTNQPCLLHLILFLFPTCSSAVERTQHGALQLHWLLRVSATSMGARGWKFLLNKVIVPQVQKGATKNSDRRMFCVTQKRGTERGIVCSLLFQIALFHQLLDFPSEFINLSCAISSWCCCMFDRFLQTRWTYTEV